MGLLDLATNPAVRFSRSGMPDAVEPLRPLNEVTAAQASLRTHAVSDVTPASVKADPPKQTLRQDLLRSGYVPGSEGDRLFVAAHGGVNVWDDPGMSHDENERTFRATNIRRQRPRSSTPENFTGNLSEEQVGELTNDVMALSRLNGATLQETLDEIEELASDYDLTPCEVVQALLDDDLLSDEVDELPSRDEALDRIRRKLVARVNEQLADLKSGARTKAPVGGLEKPPRTNAPEGKVSAPGPSTASGGPRPDRRFKPDGKKRKGSDGITTAPSAREQVPEGTASLRSIAEAHQSIRQKRSAA